MKSVEACYKIVIVGMAAVGKSSLVQRLIQNTFNEDNTPTCGADFYTYTLPLEGEQVKLQIWDTAGQERFRSISKQYFRNSVGAILVFDLANYQSFEVLAEWLNDLQTNCLPNAYVLLIGNKSDLIGDRQIGAHEIKEFADRHKLESTETSALSGKNVREAFARLAFEVATRVKNGTIGVQPPTVLPEPVAMKVDQKKCRC
jgi:small GTP-binding protein